MNEETFDAVIVRVKKFDDRVTELPVYKTPQSSGFDLCTIEDVTISPNEVVKVRTGLGFQLPTLPEEISEFIGLEIQLRPRSGKASKIYAYDLPNSPATIDEDYRGEVQVIVKNVSNTGETIHFKAGEAICQGVIVPVFRLPMKFVDELNETERGAGGFGHTDEKKEQEVTV